MCDKQVSDFRKCISTRYDGVKWRIDCKLGLWGVEAPPPRENAEQEAFHYWQQYASDGEYSSIIGGQSVIEKLTQK
tara:strand:- start:32 stop:259 length:228 start_codon:yes stop_codon:yes gene_type:complete